MLITQILAQLFILKPVVAANPYDINFILLLLISTFIIGAGYVINDIYDVEIDSVNKSENRIVERVISKKVAWRFYASLTLIGIVLSALLAIIVRSWWFGFSFCSLVFILWLYSYRLKRKLLVGNLLVAFLTVLPIVFVWWLYILQMPDLLKNQELMAWVFGYAGFAFLMNLLREIIKDMEDVPGDRIIGCRTLPIVLGIHRSKIIVNIIAVFTIFLLIGIVYVLASYNYTTISLYLVATTLVPILAIIRGVIHAKSKDDFHRMSNLSKLIMLLGVLSMILIPLYL